MSVYMRGYNLLSLENLAVCMSRGSKTTLPHFCNKAVIRTFQIKKVGLWDEVTGRITSLPVITGSLITSGACCWKEYQLCHSAACYK